VCLKCDHSNWWSKIWDCEKVISYQHQLPVRYQWKSQERELDNYHHAYPAQSQRSGGLQRAFNGTADGSRSTSPEHGVSTITRRTWTMRKYGICKETGHDRKNCAGNIGVVTAQG